jgi:hypothetical protein
MALDRTSNMPMIDTFCRDVAAFSLSIVAV